MPIDISSGTVHLDYEDASIPGKVNLVWDRRYSTGLLEQASAPLGRGWTCRYFSTLLKTRKGFEFVTPQGSIEVFDDPDGTVDQGQTVRQFGAFLEVFKQGYRYIVQRWNVDTGEVVRYCFYVDQSSKSWRISAIEDPSGQGLDLTWDEQGRLTIIQQRLEKRQLIPRYNSAGFIDRVVLRTQAGEQHLVARYEYDSEGRQIAAYDAADFSDRYEYDSNGRLTCEIAKDGGVFSYRYDNKGRCIKTSGLDRYQEKRLRFLDGPRFTEITDSYDHTFRYQHLPSGQIAREIDPLGGEKNTDYDEYGRIVTKTDGEGAVTHYTYDDYGNRAAVTNALGNTHTFTYNKDHLPLSMTDPLGYTWLRSYDLMNRLIVTQDPSGGLMKIAYDNKSQRAEITDALGARKGFQYADGSLNEVTDWLGNITRFHYDAFGRVTQRQDPLGNIVRFDYDTCGNPVHVHFPDGSEIRFSFDPAGNMTSCTRGNASTSRYRYGPCGRLVECIDELGRSVRYVWGTEPGCLDQVINQHGESFTLVRDEVGRIVREMSFDGRERLFKYDQNGRCISVLNGQREIIQLRWDPTGRLLEQNSSDGRFARFDYDERGYLVTAVNQDLAVKFLRDELGRVVKEWQGDQWVYTRYDIVGNIVRTETSQGESVDYEVDSNGLMSGLAIGRRERVAFFRDVVGRETARIIPGDLRFEQDYDQVGRLVMQKIVRGNLGDSGRIEYASSGSVFNRNYQYDDRGLLARFHGIDGGASYHYDDAERLLRVIRDHGSSEFFGYDDAGNVSHLTLDGPHKREERFTYAKGNRLVRNGRTTFEYDGQGRLIRKSEQHSADSMRTWVYVWDTLDQLRSVTLPDGEVWTYKYDAFGRRIEKRSRKAHVLFRWSRQALIGEADSFGKRSWIYAPGTSVPLATAQNGQFFSVISDHLGTPQQLLDSFGKVVWKANYRGYGSAEIATAIKDVRCQLRFQGQYFDEETGLHYNRFRYYDPSVGRFISQDPINLVGGLNLYSYCRNPINWSDPLGLTGEQDLGPDNTIHRGMQQKNGDWIPSPTTGAPNGNQLGARTITSNPKMPDVPVRAPTDIVGPSTTGNTHGLSANINDQSLPERGRIDANVQVRNLPEGLAARLDNPASGHVTIYPTRDMTFEEFQEKLNQIPWKKSPCSGG